MSIVLTALSTEYGSVLSVKDFPAVESRSRHAWLNVAAVRPALFSVLRFYEAAAAYLAQTEQHTALGL